jgi:hypothetical protein
VEAPGAHGTIMVICLVGQSAAPLLGAGARMASEIIRKRVKISATGFGKWRPWSRFGRNRFIFMVILQ